jgi:hypothetical protein
MQPLPGPPKSKVARKLAMSERALSDLSRWLASPPPGAGARLERSAMVKS